MQEQDFSTSLDGVALGGGAGIPLVLKMMLVLVPVMILAGLGFIIFKMVWVPDDFPWRATRVFSRKRDTFTYEYVKGHVMVRCNGGIRQYRALTDAEWAKSKWKKPPEKKVTAPAPIPEAAAAPLQVVPAPVRMVPAPVQPRPAPVQPPPSLQTRPAPLQVDRRQNEVLDFWFRELTPQQWFSGTTQLDTLIHDRFLVVHSDAANGRLDGWASTQLGRLALIIVLDQFSRNIHRDTARAYASDAKAQALTVEGIKLGMDKTLTFAQRHFFYMPLMHAEDPAMQALSIERFIALRDFASYILDFAKSHKEEFERFGRFPGRNAALGRSDTAEEARFLVEKS